MLFAAESITQKQILMHLNRSSLSQILPQMGGSNASALQQLFGCVLRYITFLWRLITAFCCLLVPRFKLRVTIWLSQVLRWKVDDNVQIVKLIFDMVLWSCQKELCDSFKLERSKRWLFNLMPVHIANLF